jgi:lipopolysaccharide biosynthesis protein
MRRLCIYTTVGNAAEQVRGRYVPYALRKYKDLVERLVIVTDIQAGHSHFDEISQLADSLVRSPSGEIRRPLDGYRLGLASIGSEELSSYDEVIFVDATCYGPIFPLAPLLDQAQRQLVDFWSIGFSAKVTGVHTYKRVKLDQVMSLSFFGVHSRVATSRAFQDFMRIDRGLLGFMDRKSTGEHELHLALLRAGFKWGTLMDPAQTHTAEPMLYEAPELVRLGCPIISRDVFSMDPLEVDIHAIDCRAVLDALKESGSDFDPAMIWESILPYQPLRLIQTNMDDLRVLESSSNPAAKTKWTFNGKIAVIAHIFYVDVLPEFLELISNIPSEFDLFISTSSQEHQRKIERGIESLDFGGKKEVRVVERNRGRDMSSLFITFRDVALSGEYAWVLRLHSKRTPQVSWQVGQSFKRHLIENLVPSRRFVQSLFDLLEDPDHRNVGVVVPPVVQIGFGTLGHSWFGNREPLERLARQMNINVPLDEYTPVAAYGTMYWFRPEALERMFRHDWKWEDYNEEPHHADGGLAHVQERLICYCAQQQGFRTLAVMSAGQAARNYLKLEYKHQSLSGCFPVRDVRKQYAIAKAVNWNRALRLYPRFLNNLERFDERFRRVAPKLWERSRSAVNVVWPILKGLER